MTRSPVLRLVPVALALVLAGCSPFVLLNGASSSRPYERFADLEYGPEDRQTLDVYRPVGTPQPETLIVFFYGGHWKEGDKADYEFVASSLARAGILVVIPNYRIYPDVSFPAFVEDGAAAVSWAIDNASRYGAADADVYVMGHSAGAQIAALIALDPGYLQPHGLAQRNLAGFIGLSGPYDFLPVGPDYVGVFPEETRPASQPINFAGPGAPPTLLIHGTDDDIVVSANSIKLARALTDAGASVELKTYDDVAHARTVIALAPPLRFIADTLRDVTAFVRTTGRHRGQPPA